MNEELSVGWERVEEEVAAGGPLAESDLEGMPFPDRGEPGADPSSSGGVPEASMASSEASGLSDEEWEVPWQFHQEAVSVKQTPSPITTPAPFGRPRCSRP
jgi:hypothetical protein